MAHSAGDPSGEHTPCPSPWKSGCVPNESYAYSACIAGRLRHWKRGSAGARQRGRGLGGRGGWGVGDGGLVVGGQVVWEGVGRGEGCNWGAEEGGEGEEGQG